MKTSRGFIFSLVLLALTASVITIPVQAQKRKDKRAKRIQFSGFMGDYDDLKRVDGFSDFVYGYTKKPLVLQGYRAAMVDPVLIYFSPDAIGGVALDPQRLADLTKYFRTSVLEQLGKIRDFEIVDKPGPGVMQIRIAITDLNVSRSGVNIGTRVAAMATVGAGFLVPSIDVGGATMECEILDSESGERLVAIVDTDRGRRMFNFKSMKTLGDAKAAMRQWAREFRDNLERIHEGKLPKKLDRTRTQKDGAREDD